jgi:hypothetical protein
MRLISSLLLLAFPAASCVPSDPYGDAYGVYAVTGTLHTHECGQEAAPVAIPYVRVYELRRTDTGLAYLLGSDGSIMEGSIGKDGVFRFSAQSWVRVIEPEEVLEIRGCDLVVSLVVEGSAKRSVDDESGEVTLEPLEGKLVTRISPSAGSDCSALLFGSETGGQFHALPCQIVLDLEGEPQVDEPTNGSAE